jgi:hypothetical protein
MKLVLTRRMHARTWRARSPGRWTRWLSGAAPNGLHRAPLSLRFLRPRPLASSRRSVQQSVQYVSRNRALYPSQALASHTRETRVATLRRRTFGPASLAHREPPRRETSTLARERVVRDVLRWRTDAQVWPVRWVPPSAKTRWGSAPVHRDTHAWSFASSAERTLERRLSRLRIDERATLYRERASASSSSRSHTLSVLRSEQERVTQTVERAPAPHSAVPLLQRPAPASVAPLVSRPEARSVAAPSVSVTQVSAAGERSTKPAASAAPAPQGAASLSKLEVDRLTNEVVERIERRMRIERERRGL